MIETKICIACGKRFRPNHRTVNRQKYCSKKCSDRFWNLSIKDRIDLKDLIKENKKLKKENKKLKKVNKNVNWTKD